MQNLFHATIHYHGPPPGKTQNARLQTIHGLHNSTIWAANEQLNKPELLRKLPLADGKAVQGSQPLTPEPVLQAEWSPINPATITLPPGQKDSLDGRLLSILANTNTNTKLASQHPKEKNVTVCSVDLPSRPHFDPYQMAWAAGNKIVSRLIAAGIAPGQIALFATIHYHPPHSPEQLGALVRAVQGCYDTAVSHQTPFLAGQYNETQSSETLQLTALGLQQKNHLMVTSSLKQAGNYLFVVGDTRAELGGSQFNQAGGRAEGSRTVPNPVPDSLTRLRLIHQAIQAGLVQSCHHCAEGGIATALAEMCHATQIGAELQLIHVPRDWHAAYSTDEVILFSESVSRFLVEVRPEDAPRLRELLADVPHECVAVIGGERLLVNGRTGAPILNLHVKELGHASR